MIQAAPKRDEAARRSDALSAVAAPAFVLLWSTGFIGAKFGLPYAEPLTFLSIRFVLVVLALLTAALALSALTRRDRGAAPLSIGGWAVVAAAGALMHGGYLGGVFVAVSWGLDAGLAALIAGLGPIFTALFGVALLGESMTRAQWVGFAVGLFGVAFTVSPTAGAAAPAPALAACVVAAMAFGAGSIAQRSLPKDLDVVRANIVQYGVALCVVGPAAIASETLVVEWTGEFMFALVWLTFALSIGAIGLYYALLRRRAAAKAASLVFLTPGVTAVIAALMFGETITSAQIAGFGLASLGVLLVTRRS